MAEDIEDIHDRVGNAMTEHESAQPEAAHPRLPLSATDSVGAGSRWRRVGLWMTGILLVAALVAVVLHLGELRRFAQLLEHSDPWWLALAAAAQAMTYMCAASVWYLSLRKSGVKARFRGLVPLGLVKLFADQALPSSGLSGTVVVLRILVKRGVSAAAGTMAMMLNVLTHYMAYLVAVLVTLGVLAWHHELDKVYLGLGALLALVAVIIPSGLLWGRSWLGRVPPRLLRFVPGARALLAAVTDVPSRLILHPSLFLPGALAQLGIFALDSLTLWIMLRAIGQDVGFLVAFPSLIMANVAATLGPMPLGLGTFEAMCVAVLHTLGVEIEAALTATLLLRGFTFWLPMIPGLVLTRHELGHSPTGVGSIGESALVPNATTSRG